jgi:hypothetical protein
MFIAYFDESGHPADSSLLTVAALVAPEKAWTAFEGKWRRILRRYHVTVFHMTDYENRQGEFAGWNIDKRIAFVSDFAAIIKNAIIYGVADSMPMPSWKESIGEARKKAIIGELARLDRAAQVVSIDAKRLQRI